MKPIGPSAGRESSPARVSAGAGGLLALLLIASALGLGGCGSSPKRDADSAPPPGRQPDTADAVVRDEPLSRYGNPASYVVFGKRYYTLKSAEGYQERGIASWYGTKFHGRRTSSGERYDMYGMTAAHKSLPLPTYVEVRNLKNGRTAVLRVNDRGPFHEGRIIDLSYAAALKLDIAATGTGLVEVRALTPGERRGRPLPAPDTREPLKGPAPLEVKDSGPSTGTASMQAVAPEEAISPAPEVLPVAAADGRIGILDRPPPGEPQLWVQLGAFQDAANARELADRVKAALGVTPWVLEHVNGDGVRLQRVRIGPLESTASVDALLARLRANASLPAGTVVVEP
jgi:rare lipoprotein A